MYVDDFLAGTIDMTNEEVGAYMRLLCCQWTRGVVTERHAASIGSMGGGQAIIDFILSAKFDAVDGGWRNRRLETVRSLKQIRSKLGSKGGSQAQANRQANGRANGVASSKPPTPSPIPIPIPVSISKEVASATSAASAAEATPALLTFPCRGKVSAWPLTQSQVDQWRDLYPGLDVPAECRKALAWLQPRDKKTAGGMERFLVGWLNRAADRSSAAAKPQAVSFAQQRQAANRRLIEKAAAVSRSTQQRPEAVLGLEHYDA